MQAFFEQHGQFERKVTIEIPAADIDKKVVLKLNELAKKIKISGFRPGKAPLQLLQGRYGESVRQEVVEQAIDEALRTAIKQEKVMPVATPHVHFIENTAGAALKFYAHFEVYPSVNIGDLTRIHLDIPTPVIDEQDVDEVLKHIQESHAQWDVVDTAAQLGQRITVDISGVIPGETEPFADDHDVKVVLGSKQMIPGFEEALLGLAAGEYKQFMLTFPDRYKKELAGKEAEFTLNVKTVENSILPEINDEFCQNTLGLAQGSVETLRAKVRENLSESAHERVRRGVHKKVLEKLAALSDPIDIPPMLIKNELEMLQAQHDDDLDHAVDPDTAEANANMETEAKKRVLYSLLLGQIIRDQNIQLDQKKVQAAVMKLARNSPDPESMLRWFFEDKQRIGPVSSLVLEEQALDCLLQQISCNPIEIPYKEMMAADEIGWGLTS